MKLNEEDHRTEEAMEQESCLPQGDVVSHGFAAEKIP
jgi:hypothetical protein